jgi:cell division protein FtsI/penicillin-binding protein 2
MPGAPRRRVFSEATVAWTRHAMGETLVRPRGTGHLIADERTRGLIGAKSGTSWRPNTSGSRTYCATFVAFAPLADPQYLVLAVAQKSFTHKFYGGKYAAPAARDLLLEALGGVLGSRPLASGAGAAPVVSRAMEQASRGSGGSR